MNPGLCILTLQILYKYRNRLNNELELSSHKTQVEELKGSIAEIDVCAKAFSDYFKSKNQVSKILALGDSLYKPPLPNGIKDITT